MSKFKVYSCAAFNVCNSLTEYIYVTYRQREYIALINVLN